MRGTADPQVADQVLRYISNARWFAGKGRRVQFRSLTPLPWLTDVSDFFRPAAALGVRFEIAEVSYPPEEDPEQLSTPTDLADQDTEPTREAGPSEPPEMIQQSDPAPTEYYHLAVSYRPAPHAELHQAEIGRFTDPDLGPVIAYDATQDPEACRVILTALLGGRRLRSPDCEARFNTTTASGLRADLEARPFTGQQSNTSVMLGETAILKLFRRLELGHNLDIEVHAALNAAGISDVAGLFGWIEGSWVSDARQLDADLAMVIEQLAGAADGWDLALESLRVENASNKIKTSSNFAAEAEALGRALAEIHQALRSSFPTAKVLGARTARIMMDRLHQAAKIVAALAPYVPDLLRRFRELGAETLDTQRVHGDFHLGQTLHTPSGWKIIDFEGEPAKTLAERRLPDSVWRDVAGMLRSFDYAAASVPGPYSAAWAAECRAAFLRGYVSGELDETETSVLRAYEADKAIYEVVYETRNRPDWISIPLRAVAELAGENQDSDQVSPGELASRTREQE
ncbi:MAG TPA: phosphotransferase [Propionibacteriaceae bacterium]|nr:phosphotransferase [Propionibacteriaceae bacterium]